MRAASASTAPSGRVPSHAAAMAARLPSTWPSQHSPAVWRSTRSVTDQPSDAGLPRPTPSGTFVEDDVGCDQQRDVEELLVRRAVDEAGQFEDRSEVVAARHRPVLRRLLGAEPRRPCRSLPHADEAETDGFDVVLFVVVHPGVELGCPLVGRFRLSEPTRRVGARFQHLPFEHQGVALRALEPAVQPLAPVLPAHVRPRRQQLAMSAVGEMARGRSDELPTDLVDGHFVVAEEVPARRGDHERRVGHDQVEALAFDRFEQAALPDGHVGDVVQFHGQRRAGPGPRVEVGRDDASGVFGCVQGLHAATGAEVERAGDLTADRRAGECLCRRAHPEHVIVRQRRAVPSGEVVGDQPVRRTTHGTDGDPAGHVGVVRGEHTAGDPFLDGQRLQRRPRRGE